MALTRAVIPQMRARKSGVIVNVSSSTTLSPMPFLSIYAASKAAVNTFTEGLALELEPFGIRARLVIPGRAPDTRFSATAQSNVAANGGFPEAYAVLVQQLFARYAQAPQDQVTHAQDVAEVVWRAVTDPASPIRLPAGADAVTLSK
jgi:short-subunit dehydrogenase